MSRIDGATLADEFARCVSNLSTWTGHGTGSDTFRACIDGRITAYNIATVRLLRRVEGLREIADEAESAGRQEYAEGLRAAARMLGGEP